MKKISAILLMMICCGFFVLGQESVDLQKETAAVKAAALDYIEGWYEGSAERMARALHPALNKVGLRALRPGGKAVLTPLGYSIMVEYAAMGLGKDVPVEKRNISVTVLDIFKNIASVKTVSGQFIDYLSLAKMDGQWKIVNVLWEPAQ